MSYFRTGDPLDDFLRYDLAQEIKLARRPCCTSCGHHIQDEEAYFIFDKWFCMDCMEEHLVPVDDD